MIFASSSSDVNQFDLNTMKTTFVIDNLQNNQHFHVNELFEKTIRTMQIIVVIHLRFATIRRIMKTQDIKKKFAKSLFYSAK